MNSLALQCLQTSINSQKHRNRHSTHTCTQKANLKPRHFIVFQHSPLKISINLPDLAPFVMIEVTDSIGSDDKDGGVFMLPSGKLLAAESGDQPLCLFLGGPEFECGAEILKNKDHKKHTNNN